MRKFRTQHFLIIICFSLIASGCVYQKKFQSKPNDYGSRQISGHDSAGYSRPLSVKASQITDHRNTTLAYSQEASNIVSAMSGIRDAFVVMTDKNAYVAIILDGTATGSKGKGIEVPSDNTITSNQYHFVPRTHDTVPPGTIMYNKYTFDTVPDNRDISSELKQELTSKITRKWPELKGVFISANRSFINEMSQLAHMSWRGEPIHPHLSRFNSLVTQQFGEDSLIFTPNSR